MRCPKCGFVEDKVVDSRSSKDGLSIRRRRQCLDCNQRYTTYEEIERGNLMVIKDGGARERFSRDKLESGINIACQKRPINAEAIDQAIREIVNELFDEFDGEVPSKAIGGKVMSKLKNLDGVAYVRFASVYWRFDDAAEFLEAVQKFGNRDDTATIKLLLQYGCNMKKMNQGGQTPLDYANQNVSVIGQTIVYLLKKNLS